MKRTLFDLEPGQEAIVMGIEGQTRLKRRLAEMGFVRGAHVAMDRVAPLGDPRAYTLRGYQVSLRNEEARQITLIT